MALSLCVGGTVVASPTADAAAAVDVRLGKVRGPSWSRVRAAIQVVMAAHPDVRMVRSGEQVRLGGRTRETGGVLLAELSLIDASGEVLKRARFRGVSGRDLAADIKARLWDEFSYPLTALKNGQKPAKLAAVKESKNKASRAQRSRSTRPRSSSKSRSESSVRARSASSRRSGPRPTGSREPAAEARAEVSLERNGSPVQLGDEALRFNFGVGVFSRQLNWVDDLFGQLAGYELGAAPALRIDAQWFPGAHVAKTGPARWVGLEVEAELPFGVESNRDGQSFPTAASAWRFGLVGRLPLDFFEGQLSLGYSERRFHVEESAEGFEIPDLPEVRYQTFGARLAAAVRIFDRVDLVGRAGWGFMLDAGPIGRANWFPRSSSHTASAGGTLKVDIINQLGAFARFDWHGAFFDFNSEPGDARVAGGAADHYYMGVLGVAFAAPGT